LLQTSAPPELRKKQESDFPVRLLEETLYTCRVDAVVRRLINGFAVFYNKSLRRSVANPGSGSNRV